MIKWGLKTKILLLTLAPTLAVALLLGGLFLQLRFDGLNESLVANGQATSQKFIPQLQQQLALPKDPKQNALFQKIANQLLEESDVRAVTLYGLQQQFLAHAGPRIQTKLSSPTTLNQSPNVYHTKNSLLFLTPIYPMPDLTNDILTQAPITPTVRTQPIGWIALELTSININLKKYQLIFITGLIILLSALINSLLALHMSQSIVESINKMILAIHRIKEGHLETRIHSRSNGEMHQLETSINTMAEAFQIAQEDLRQNVDQAAEDLRETLETIEIQNIELDLARKEALESSRIKSEFLANMSHEIRTPLNGIIGFTKILLKDELSLRHRDYLNTIEQSSDGLLSIINDILDFSKIEAGKLILDNASLNIRRLVEEVLTLVAPLAHEKQLELVALIYADVPVQLMGDSLRLKQVLTNLVSNAIKFTERGNVILRVVAEKSQAQEILLKISITDTGIGLSHEAQKNIFSAFNQADASTTRRFGGTGLGLVISKHLVEQMSGNIGLESEPGKGSTFWFTVRMMIDHKNKNTASFDLLRDKRIALFDSNPIVRLSLHHMLDSWNARTVEIPSFDELTTQLSLAKTIDETFDICLIGLPHNKSLPPELIETIKTIEQTIGCRCIVLTNTHDVASVSLSLENIASGYVAKPVCHNKLYTTLVEILYPHHQSNQNHHLQTPAIEPLKTRPKILAVDDNPSNLKLLCALLEDLNVITIPCESGQQAIDCLKTQQISLILMDIQMPDMDGIEATQYIRAIEKPNERIPIIAVTAHAMADEQKALFKAGIDDYITKPINDIQLIQLIQQWTGCAVRSRSKTTTTAPIVEESTQTTEPVNLAESLRLANNKSDLANDLLVMLLNTLPQDKIDIQTSWEDEDYSLLLEKVHKLHGATRYCGVPLLRDASHHLETLIKQKQYALLPDALKRLFNEMQQIQDWVEQHHPDRSFYSAYSFLPNP